MLWFGASVMRIHKGGPLASRASHFADYRMARCLFRGAFGSTWSHLLTTLMPNEKGQHSRPSKNPNPSESYRPAPAAAAAGIIPAIFIPSMRVNTDSMLDPVSTHASTYGWRLPSACITRTLVSALDFFTI